MVIIEDTRFDSSPHGDPFAGSLQDLPRWVWDGRGQKVGRFGLILVLSIVHPNFRWSLTHWHYDFLLEDHQSLTIIIHQIVIIIQLCKILIPRRLRPVWTTATSALRRETLAQKQLEVFKDQKSYHDSWWFPRNMGVSIHRGTPK